MLAHLQSRRLTCQVGRRNIFYQALEARESIHDVEEFGKRSLPNSQSLLQALHFKPSTPNPNTPQPEKELSANPADSTDLTREK